MRRFPIEGGLLLLEETSNRLFAYNETARLVWDLIAAGRSEAEVVAEFARHWAIPAATARADVRSILAQWRTQGLLTGCGFQAGSNASGAEESVDRPRAVPSRAAWICTFRGVAIAFDIESDLLAFIRAMLAHLETPAAQPQLRIDITATVSGESVLLRDGVEIIRTRDPAELIGGLWQTVLESIHPDVAWLALIHGAAMADRGRGLAVSGPSGSGKSTLAAGLLRAGFDFLADDLVALSAPHGEIVPWPLPLSIKSGSAEIIGRRFPQLVASPPYPTKGTQARLLVPSPDAWNLAAVPLRWFIFPRFTAGSAPTCRRMSPFEAVERLIADRIWLGANLTEEIVAGFIGVLNATPAYAVTYDKLDDGVRVIKDIVS